MFIPPVKPFFSEADRNYILTEFDEILKGNGFLSQHKHCKEFERQFSEYTNSPFSVTASNGTATLDMIYASLDLKGGEVIVPSNTMAATVFPLVLQGIRPVFADCLDDMTLDPSEVKRKMSDKTKAVVTVHIGGLVSPKTIELKEICEENDISLIEDAAHAQGSTLSNVHAGTFGVAGSFSFFSTKVMTTGEGGMVTTNDETINEKILLYRDQAKVNHQNYHETLGFNYRMCEVNALMGIRQLSMLDNFINKR